MLMNTQGLVLGRKKVADSDVIITLFTKTQGKLRVYANGARHPKSKFASGTQPFVEGEFALVIKKDLSSLNEITIKDAHVGIRSDMNRLFLGSYMLELIDAALEDGDHINKLYDVVVYAIRALETATDLKVLKVVYGLKIAQKMGFEPVLFSCSSCGTQKNLTPNFSVNLGGVLCGDCAGHLTGITKITLEHLKWINVALKSPFSTIQDLNVSDRMITEIDFLVDRFIEAHLVRRPLKSLEVLKQM
ncbi:MULTISPECIES: DNA repair protein RecO [unclassified Fusibacter]|uniref:DNA repair protein RecO n=1 Tax=unclassified Fusibacter TaxID=2624464 RepID=UPI001010C90E|nr:MULTISPECIES: DNA repair protein RecO [unclassified Fusibacter]MCK8058112.1 DNA repair protein RecO [Fusibacter sp. A2]NPE20694.1 DNA repair protein RecO [Fusibacter sp. A1]RXV62900.1 DNA repair protein RecO [Fusibacter sp. A1]